MRIPRIKYFSTDDDEVTEEEIKLYKKNGPKAALQGLGVGGAIGAATWKFAPGLGEKVGIAEASEDISKYDSARKEKLSKELKAEMDRRKGEISAEGKKVRDKYGKQRSELEKKISNSRELTKDINSLERGELDAIGSKIKDLRKNIKGRNLSPEELEKAEKTIREATGKKVRAVKDKFEGQRKGIKGYISEDTYNQTKRELGRLESEEMKRTLSPLRKKHAEEFKTLAEGMKRKSEMGLEAFKGLASEKKIKSATRKIKGLGYAAAGLSAAGTYLHNKRKKIELS